jgi:succinoglycan biosynthesis protein ExoO
MSHARPLVSVVTANYNGAPHLASAIRSVLDQSLADFELIIVDDCSTDDSLAVIARAAAGDPRVKVLAQAANGGPGAARNRGLDSARGHWISIFDSDDLMAPERLERLVERAERDGCDILVDNLMVFDDRGEAAERPFLPLAADAPARWITLCDYIGASRVYARTPSLGYLKPLFRTEALHALRYCEGLKIGEDYDLVLRLLLQGARMRLEPRAFYRYRKHASSISSVLHREHIKAMMAADRSLGAEFACRGPTVGRMQRARTRAFERALVYDRLIARLKARQLAPACALALARPGVLPLLAMPIEARLKRLGARLRVRGGAAAKPPSPPALVA